MENTILFVDDEPNILSSLQREFRQEGYNILTAGSGKEGIEVLRKNRVSVVISDHRMPLMDGTQFLSIAKELSPETVRCMLTGYADLSSVMAAINKGEVYRYILKPWDNDEIKQIVRDAVDRYNASLENRDLSDAVKRQNVELTELMFMEAENEAKKKAGKTVLVADDSVFFRTRLSDILTEAGHGVKFATNGQEVIDALSSGAQKIDLLVLDLQMPEIDGFAVLKWMNENGYRRRVPVLVATGAYETGQVLEMIKNLGAVGLLSKGLTPEQVKFRVNRALFPEKAESGKTKWKRVPVSVPVDFTHGGNTRTGYFLNISETGAFLYAKAEYNVGTALGLKFSIPGRDRVIDAIGVIQWKTSEIYNRNLFGGYGIMFESISEEDRALLGEFVAEEGEKIS